MKVKIDDIIKYMEAMAPLYLADDWDNCGLIIGDRTEEAKNILLSLDFTEAALEEAIDTGSNLVITHHPFFFTGQKKVNADTPIGKRAVKAIKNGINVYSAHTNLDYAHGGTNDTLFSLLGLKEKDDFMVCAADNNYSLGKVGSLSKPMSLRELSTYTAKILDCPSLRFIGEEEKIIEKAAISTGSGANTESFFKALEKNCDVYITSDIKYHQAMDALDMGLALIDATHYATENIVLKSMKVYLDDMFLKDKIPLKVFESKALGQPFKTI